jgi:hypothetical protein
MKMPMFARFLALFLAASATLSCFGLLGRKGTKDSKVSKPGVLASDKRDNYTIASSEGRFSVDLPPGFPVPEQDGKKYRSLKDDRGGCMVQYMDIPEASTNDSQRVLSVARDVAMKRQNTTVDKEERIVVQGHPGLSVYASGARSGSETTLYYRHKYVLAATRLYEVSFIASSPEELDMPDIAAYFDSFRSN